jgi:hypothetical protein
MQNNVGPDMPVNGPEFENKSEITEGVGAAAVHPYIVVNATSLDKFLCITVDGSYCMNFMSLRKERPYEAHPEIVNVPGSVKYYRNFHLANYRPGQFPR